MRMQEVIARMREDVPLLDKRKDETARQYRTVRALLQDYRGAGSEIAREVLSGRLAVEAGRLDDLMAGTFALVERLKALNDGYTRKLGPRPKAPRDDPRQQTLPGLGPDPAPGEEARG